MHQRRPRDHNSSTEAHWEEAAHTLSSRDPGHHPTQRVRESRGNFTSTLHLSASPGLIFTSSLVNRDASAGSCTGGGLHAERGGEPQRVSGCR